MKPLRIVLAFAVPLTVLAGCKAASVALPSTSLAEVVALSQGVLSGALVQSSVPKDGLANLRVQMNILDGASGYRLQALPGAWTEAVVSLHSDSVNTAYDADYHTRSLAIGAFNNRTSGMLTNLVNDNAIAVAVGPDGSVYFADHNSRRIVKRDKNGTLTTVAGPGTSSDLGDGKVATQGYINNPRGVAVDPAGNLYIADAGNHRVRKVDRNGIITTFAGTNDASHLGDGGPAAQAYLNSPNGVAVDAAGNVYIAESTGNRIRKVSAANGTISTIAGTGSAGYDGENTTATVSRISGPYAVAVDAAGHVYISEPAFDRVRKIDATSGNISTIAGTGTQGVAADGQLATSTNLYDPRGLAVDNQGHVYFSEYNNMKIRKIDASSKRIVTIAGNGTFANGGNGTATQVALGHLTGVALDQGGTNIYIADPENNRLRRVALTTNYAATFAFPPLRPAPDYEARVYLKNATGGVKRLAASQVKQAVGLKAGQNALAIDVTVNGDEAAYSLTSSENGNKVQGNTITKDDVVTLKTGLMALQPGVARLDVSLKGEVYQGGGPVLVKRFDATASAEWDNFEWDTTATAEQYVPSRFRGGADLAASSGQLIFEAFNDREEAVGSSVLPVQVYGRARVQIRLR